MVVSPCTIKLPCTVKFLRSTSCPRSAGATRTLVKYKLVGLSITLAVYNPFQIFAVILVVVIEDVPDSPFTNSEPLITKPLAYKKPVYLAEVPVVGPPTANDPLITVFPPTSKSAVGLCTLIPTPPPYGEVLILILSPGLLATLISNIVSSPDCVEKYWILATSPVPPAGLLANSIPDTFSYPTPELTFNNPVVVTLPRVASAPWIPITALAFVKYKLVNSTTFAVVNLFARDPGTNLVPFQSKYPSTCIPLISTSVNTLTLICSTFAITRALVKYWFVVSITFAVVSSGLTTCNTRTLVKYWFVVSTTLPVVNKGVVVDTTLESKLSILAAVNKGVTADTTLESKLTILAAVNKGVVVDTTLESKLTILAAVNKGVTADITLALV